MFLRALLLSAHTCWNFSASRSALPTLGNKLLIHFDSGLQTISKLFFPLTQSAFSFALKINFWAVLFASRLVALKFRWKLKLSPVGGMKRENILLMPSRAFWESASFRSLRSFRRGKFLSAFSFLVFLQSFLMKTPLLLGNVVKWSFLRVLKNLTLIFGGMLIESETRWTGKFIAAINFRELCVAYNCACQELYLR